MRFLITKGGDVDVVIGKKEKHEPMTTVMLALTTSTTDNPAKAIAYCIDRFPTLRATPPAIANNTEGQFS